MADITENTSSPLPEPGGSGECLSASSLPSRQELRINDSELTERVRRIFRADGEQPDEIKNEACRTADQVIELSREPFKRNYRRAIKRAMGSGSEENIQPVVELYEAFHFNARCERAVHNLVERIEICLGEEANRTSDILALTADCDLRSRSYLRLAKGCRDLHQVMFLLREQLGQLIGFVGDGTSLPPRFAEVLESSEAASRLQKNEVYDILEEFIDSVGESPAGDRKAPVQSQVGQVLEAKRALKLARDREQACSGGFRREYEKKNVHGTPIVRCSYESLLTPGVAEEVANIMVPLHRDPDDPEFETSGGFALEQNDSKLKKMARKGAKLIAVRGKDGELRGAMVYFEPKDSMAFDPNRASDSRDRTNDAYAALICRNQSRHFDDDPPLFHMLVMGMSLHLQRKETKLAFAEITPANLASFFAAVGSGAQVDWTRLSVDIPATGESLPVDCLEKEPDKGECQFVGIEFVIDPELWELTMSIEAPMRYVIRIVDDIHNRTLAIFS